ncbi:MAG TPA: MraY family glycosyltransferase [Negativicutes bacterium]|nr:MraY family glycosyltransferase [Negativicutes bacterium]
MFTISVNIVLALFATFFTGIVLIPWLRNLSEKKQLVVDIAKGDVLKIHKKPTSLLGGVGMVGAMVAGFLFLLNGNALYVAAVVVGLSIITGLGFWDDMKWKHISTIKPKIKFFWLLVCTFLPAAILAFYGIGFMFIPTMAVSAMLSFIYIFVVINAVNYQDGMDGLAAGLVAISLAGFMVLSIITGNYFAFSLCVVVLAAVISFLVFNFPPAKIFMGDSGSYALGFMLAVIAMQFSKQYHFTAALAPIIIIGLPVIDGVFTNIRRLTNGKSIFLGDRAHFYDRLMQYGFSVKKTLAICYGLQMLLVVLGVMFYRYYA